MILDELMIIKRALGFLSVRFPVIDEAYRIINREITLKTLDPRQPKVDVSGNSIERED